MSSETSILMATAATIGFFHTLIGPDHYVPFIVLSKARGWSSIKTAIITVLCGIGHVLSSVILGFVGIAVGIAIFKLEAIESLRGDIAAWLLIAFGFTYLIWGIQRALRNKPHEHPHLHENGIVHTHTHIHSDAHAHVHRARSAYITPWILFIIFVFGPCEPLIPLVMYPAARGNIISVVIVASIFGLTTITTMLGIVLLSFYGLSKLPIHRIEKYSHAFAGLAIFLCGSAIQFLGL